MSRRIFLSYRQKDSAAQAGRVTDRLHKDFGDGCSFLDVDSIPLGVNFARHLTAEVATCEVLLAVIGPQWLDVRGERNDRRLDDPNDFVRIEIGAALQRDIPVIPVLVDGATVPRPGDLPEDLRELAYRNGISVRHSSFHSDMDRLVSSLKLLLEKRQSESTQQPATVQASQIEPSVSIVTVEAKPRLEPQKTAAEAASAEKDSLKRTEAEVRKEHANRLPDEGRKQKLLERNGVLGLAAAILLGLIAASILWAELTKGPGHKVEQVAPNQKSPAEDRNTDTTNTPSYSQKRSDQPRAILYDDPADSNGKQYAGSVTWHVEAVIGSNDHDLGVRAVIEIPDRKLKIEMLLRRIGGRPASFNAELTSPQDFSDNGFTNVQGILAKSNQQADGIPLYGKGDKMTNRFFIFRLANVDWARAKNLTLLKESTWFEISLVDIKLRRSILAIERDRSADRVFSAVFAAWGE